MSTFRQRLASALHFERAVISALGQRGWVAASFGQGQLPEPVREVLRETATPIRYMPDVIAARRFPVGVRVALVDAKAGNRWRDTGMHDLEVAAVMAAQQWERMSRCPVYFVFSDGGTLTTAVVQSIARPGRYRGAGSGTPFVLVPRVACVPFDAVFGAVVA